MKDEMKPDQSDTKKSIHIETPMTSIPMNILDKYTSFVSERKKETSTPMTGIHMNFLDEYASSVSERKKETYLNVMKKDDVPDSSNSSIFECVNYPYSTNSCGRTSNGVSSQFDNSYPLDLSKSNGALDARESVHLPQLEPLKECLKSEVLQTYGLKSDLEIKNELELEVSNIYSNVVESLFKHIEQFNPPESIIMLQNGVCVSPSNVPSYPKDTDNTNYSMKNGSSEESEHLLKCEEETLDFTLLKEDVILIDEEDPQPGSPLSETLSRISLEDTLLRDVLDDNNDDVDAMVEENFVRETFVNEDQISTSENMNNAKDKCTKLTREASVSPCFLSLKNYLNVVKLLQNIDISTDRNKLLREAGTIVYKDCNNDTYDVKMRKVSSTDIPSSKDPSLLAVQPIDEGTFYSKNEDSALSLTPPVTLNCNIDPGDSNPLNLNFSLNPPKQKIDNDTKKVIMKYLASKKPPVIQKPKSVASTNKLKSTTVNRNHILTGKIKPLVPTSEFGTTGTTTSTTTTTAVPASTLLQRPSTVSLPVPETCNTASSGTYNTASSGTDQGNKRPLSVRDDQLEGSESLLQDLKKIRVFEHYNKMDFRKVNDSFTVNDRAIENTSEMNNDKNNTTHIDKDHLEKRNMDEVKNRNFDKQNLKRIKRKNLESLVIELLCDKVLFEHQLGQQKDLIKKLEATLKANRKKAIQFHKEIESLKEVTEKLKAEYIKRKDNIIVPLKVKRSVGIQAMPLIIAKGIMESNINPTNCRTLTSSVSSVCLSEANRIRNNITPTISTSTQTSDRFEPSKVSNEIRSIENKRTDISTQTNVLNEFNKISLSNVPTTINTSTQTSDFFEPSKLSDEIRSTENKRTDISTQTNTLIELNKISSSNVPPTIITSTQTISFAEAYNASNQVISDNYVPPIINASTQTNSSSDNKKSTNKPSNQVIADYYVPPIINGLTQTDNLSKNKKSTNKTSHQVISDYYVPPIINGSTQTNSSSKIKKSTNKTSNQVISDNYVPPIINGSTQTNSSSKIKKSINKVLNQVISDNYVSPSIIGSTQTDSLSKNKKSTNVRLCPFLNQEKGSSVIQPTTYNLSYAPATERVVDKASYSDLLMALSATATNSLGDPCSSYTSQLFPPKQNVHRPKCQESHTQSAITSPSTMVQLDQSPLSAMSTMVDKHVGYLQGGGSQRIETSYVVGHVDEESAPSTSRLSAVHGNYQSLQSQPLRNMGQSGSDEPNVTLTYSSSKSQSMLTRPSFSHPSPFTAMSDTAADLQQMMFPFSTLATDSSFNYSSNRPTQSNNLRRFTPFSHFPNQLVNQVQNPTVTTQSVNWSPTRLQPPTVDPMLPDYSPFAPISAPLPLPSFQKRFGVSEKMPPRLSLKLKQNDNCIFVSWNLAQPEEHESIASYQLYAYQEGTNNHRKPWKKVGNIKPLQLPMACTLTHYLPGHVYYFTVRAVDIANRAGPFSETKSIRLG